MHRFIALVALLALPASLAAQSIEVSQPSYKISGGSASWDYTVEVKAVATPTKIIVWFPLIDPRTNTSVFPGDNPIINSYNGSFFLGVFIPVDILKAMRPGGQ